MGNTTPDKKSLQESNKSEDYEFFNPTVEKSNEAVLEKSNVAAPEHIQYNKNTTHEKAQKPTHDMQSNKNNGLKKSTILFCLGLFFSIIGAVGLLIFGVYLICAIVLLIGIVLSNFALFMYINEQTESEADRAQKKSRFLLIFTLIFLVFPIILVLALGGTFFGFEFLFTLGLSALFGSLFYGAKKLDKIENNKSKSSRRKGWIYLSLMAFLLILGVVVSVTLWAEIALIIAAVAAAICLGLAIIHFLKSFKSLKSIESVVNLFYLVIALRLLFTPNC